MSDDAPMIAAMRLAIVETVDRGGLLHYAAQLADGLAAHGADVDLVVPAGHELEGHVSRARVRPVLLAVRGTGPQPRRPRLRRARIALRLTASWAHIIMLARRHRYDVVIVNGDLHLWLPAAAALLLTHVPGRSLLVDVCHNARPFNRWGGSALENTSGLLHTLLRRLYPRFDLVVVHGERSVETFRETWPPSQIATIPHGDEGLFGDAPAPAEEERILFFGDWRKVKGLDVLMEAFDRLAERRPSARLTIAGSPSEADYDPEAVRRWARGHGERVEVVDRYIPIEEVRALFARARVVTTPYLTGYQSGVLHLAKTMGRAVVTSDVGDLPDAVVDGSTGRVVASGDVAALTDALEQVIADPALADRWGAAAREHLAGNASWERVADQLQALLDELASREAANGARPSHR